MGNMNTTRSVEIPLHFWTSLSIDLQGRNISPVVHRNYVKPIDVKIKILGRSAVLDVPKVEINASITASHIFDRLPHNLSGVIRISSSKTDRNRRLGMCRNDITS